MILPFVREILADAEKSTAFQRAASLLRGRAGRARVSGLTPSAKTLYLPLLQRACGRPLIVVVANNRTADELMPPLQAFAELTSAVNPASIVKLPAYDVLPFENLSPHPELQEERAAALWKIASGTVSILVTPLEAAAMRLQSVEKYAELARVLRRGDIVDPEEAIEHLNLRGSMRIGAGCWTSTHRKPRGRIASSCLGMRSNPSAASIPERSARQAPQMKLSCWP